MSSLETQPDEVACGGEDPGTQKVSMLEPREVPLGGPRAMSVRRTLPSRARTMIGAWCFVDHYGPNDVRTGAMVVPPHPHTALQTVSWLFSGEIEHRDSTGVRATVRPGELNLMTAGHGVCHSEVSVRSGDTRSEDTVLHGTQLWVALPAEHADVAPAFEHFAPEPAQVEGAVISVFLGALGMPDGTRVDSPVTTYTPLLGAEITLEPGAELVLRVDPAFEHGVLNDSGDVDVVGGAGREGEFQRVAFAHLAYLTPGQERLRLRAGDQGARVLLLGGPPFGEQIVMWWNFIGRSHDDVVAAREQWQRELATMAFPNGRFGAVDHPGLDALPAPALPHVRLRPRG